MRAGIVDGSRLARALEDEQSQATDDIFMQVQDMALSLQDKMSSALRDADAWSFQAPDFRATVERKESTKWENLGSRAGSLGGGIAGAWGGAKLGASIGSLGGPAGAAIGGAVGAVIGGILSGLAGNWLGNKGKEAIIEQRAKAAEEEVFAAINTYLSESSKALNKIAVDFCDQLDTLLEQWRQAEIASFELERQQSLESMKMSDDEKARAGAALEADQVRLDTLQMQLSKAST
jgi:phage tail tape-measure protein